MFIPSFLFLFGKKWQLYHVLINFELEKAKKLQTRCGFESEGDTGMKLVDQDLPWTLSSGPDNCLAREGAGTSDWIGTGHTQISAGNQKRVVNH